MGYVVGVAAIIALLQGMAWLGATGATPRRRWRGTALATVGTVALVAALAQVLVPGFFADA